MIRDSRGYLNKAWEETARRRVNDETLKRNSLQVGVHLIRDFTAHSMPETNQAILLSIGDVFEIFIGDRMIQTPEEPPV
ncbi:hypothetical protein RB195_026233 [Necator americanus]|uniref:Uncharacterized protein n=1 Tax=Necator americanus TaxID=51031 RepID=A0ABR1EVZ4_NECAM